MKKERLFLHLQYGAALLAAPVFCLLYIEIFQRQTENIFWLFSDTRSLFFLILLYPVIEEMLFRGMIQEFIGQKTEQYGHFFCITIANLLTSILFVLMHFIHHSPVWAILTLFPSLIFGYFKERYNNIIPSIILHIFYNLNYFSLIG